MEDWKLKIKYVYLVKPALYASYDGDGSQNGVVAPPTYVNCVWVTIGHFRIPLSLSFKTSLSAKV